MVHAFSKCCACCAFLVAGILLSPRPLVGQSAWAAIGPNGKLVYRHLPGGDHIADFSSAGYKGGGVALPAVAMKRTVTPSGQDDTAAIQKAIDEVAKLPLVDGVRGAVILKKGTFHCSETIVLAASGVVLRGEGADHQGTTIVMTGDPHVAIRIGGKLNVQKVGAAAKIADAYVPSGAASFHVTDASGFHAGDTLLIVRPITAEWVHFLGMDRLGLRGGKPEHWIEGTLDVRRRIASVNGNQVTLEVPLMDAYDNKYLGTGTVDVTKVEVSGQVEEVGIENLRIVAPSRSITLGLRSSMA